MRSEFDKRESAKTQIFINGRFLTQSVSGVQRYARELVLAFDELMDDGFIDDKKYALTVLHPRAGAELVRYRNIAVRCVGRFKGHLWEQADLPIHVGSELLLNLGNSAPMVKRIQILTIHDAAVCAVPKAYTRAFRVWYRMIYLIAGRRATRIITVSQFSKRELVARLGLPAERISVVAEGSDHILRVKSDESVLERFGLHIRPFILAVSSLSPHKNFKAIVQAMEIGYWRDVDLVIVGGANPNVFATRDAPLPSLAAVKHVGRVSDGELRALYEHAACFVFPSLYEGFGIPPIEAMACGCPVSVSNAASLPEVCADAALYYDPRSPPDIAAKLQQLLHDDTLRALLSARGRARAAQFTWRLCAEQVWREILIVLGEMPAMRVVYPGLGGRRS